MYELLYIVPAPFTEKDLSSISKKIKEIIQELDGKITKEQNLSNKKLAYPIKQVHRGFYILVNFEIAAEKLQELDQKLKLTAEILRHMVVRAIIVKERPIDILEEKPKKVEKIEKEDVEEKKEEIKKDKKIDLKKLGDKIDELLKI